MPRRSSSPSLYEKKITVPTKMPETQRPSFVQTMKEGLALGVGSSIGHRIVGAVLGSSSPAIHTKNEEYEKCMKDTNDKSGCEYLLK
jgi:hypothetical protein